MFGELVPDENMRNLTADLPVGFVVVQFALRLQPAGAAQVMRGEMLLGNADRLPRLLPSFAFLVALSIAGKEKALEVSERAEQLMAAPDGIPAH